jgi:hypothetical protein
VTTASTWVIGFALLLAAAAVGYCFLSLIPDRPLQHDRTGAIPRRTSGGADFSDYEAEHRHYSEAVVSAETSLRAFGRVHRLDRSFLPNYLFAPDALVVVLGQDGLVANTLNI